MVVKIQKRIHIRKKKKLKNKKQENKQKKTKKNRKKGKMKKDKFSRYKEIIIDLFNRISLILIGMLSIHGIECIDILYDA